MIYRVILCKGDDKEVLTVDVDKAGKPARVGEIWPVWVDGKQVQYEVCEVDGVDVYVKLPT